MKDFLEKEDCADLIGEYEQNNTLSDSSRRRLVISSVNLLRKLFGNYPTPEQKISAAKAIINLFPSYKTSNEEFGGIVSCFSLLNTYIYCKIHTYIVWI